MEDCQGCGETIELKGGPDLVRAPENMARLTVSKQFAHQRCGHDPIDGSNIFVRWLKTDAMPYKRPAFKVGTDWVKVDIGWIESCGLLVIKSDLPPYSSPKLRQEAMTKTIEVSCKGSESAWLIPPGESFIGTPEDASKVFLRCKQGDAFCTICAFPR